MPKDNVQTTDYSVPAVERALDILEYTVEKNAAVSIQEIVGALAFPKASVFRIFRTLETRGYLAAGAHPNTYVPGPRVLLLGSRITKEENLRQLASSAMFKLAEQTNQTVQLGILFGYNVLYIDQVRTAMRSDLRIEPTGVPFSVNVSAGGKVLVANLPDEKREELLKNAELTHNTEKSITDHEQLRAELEDVRSKGYALDQEEFAIGIRCVAAPILDASGKCVASVGITGHVSSMSNDKMPDLIQATILTAKEISRTLGNAISQ